MFVPQADSRGQKRCRQGQRSRDGEGRDAGGEVTSHAHEQVAALKIPQMPLLGVLAPAPVSAGHGTTCGSLPAGPTRSPIPTRAGSSPLPIHRMGPCQSTQSRPSATSDPSLPVHVHIQPRALTAGTHGRRLPAVRISADRRLLQVFVPQGTPPRLVQQEPVCAASGAGSRAQPSGAHGAVSHTRLGQCPQNTLRCRTWGHGARGTWACNAH